MANLSRDVRVSSRVSRAALAMGPPRRISQMSAGCSEIVGDEDGRFAKKNLLGQMLTIVQQRPVTSLRACFHGSNRGSNPRGDAINIKGLQRCSPFSLASCLIRV